VSANHNPQKRSQAIYNTNYLRQWTKEVMQHMSHLSTSQAAVLALWSFGIVLARASGLSSVSAILAALCGQKEASLRQRLREWYWDKEAKRGKHRCELEVRHSFAALLRWVLTGWSCEEHRLALAMDATYLKDRFIVLAISVVYRGCALPVAWKVLPANHKKVWKDEWLTLLAAIGGVIPSDWLVLVLADRGLYAPWLFNAIRRQAWHPFLRINRGGKYRLENAGQWYWLNHLATQPGCSASLRVVCFKKQPLRATVLVRWEPEQSEPWLILTDLAPEQAEAGWYGLRPWVECGFKHTKRGGWQWQNTHMTDPDRASRLWLAMAVASLWVVSIGGEADASLPASSLAALPDTHVARRKRRTPSRLLSCFRRGILIISASLYLNKPLPIAAFTPEPWSKILKTYP
jgi:hypothetical protein